MLCLRSSQLLKTVTRIYCICIQIHNWFCWFCEAPYIMLIAWIVVSFEVCRVWAVRIVLIRSPSGDIIKPVCQKLAGYGEITWPRSGQWAIQLFADLLPVLSNKLPFFPSTVHLSCSFAFSVCLGLLQETYVLRLQGVGNFAGYGVDVSLDDRLSWVFTWSCWAVCWRDWTILPVLGKKIAIFCVEALSWSRTKHLGRKILS